MSTPKSCTQNNCKTCKKTFKTGEALWQHCNDKKHPRCEQCQRAFTTQDGLRAHNGAKHSPNQPTSSPIPRHHLPSSNTITAIQYNGNDYSASSTLDPAELSALLLAQCHSRECLTKNGYCIADVSGMIFQCSKNPDAPKTLFFQSPEPSFLNPKRIAVVVDCEMVGCEDGRDEAVHLSAIDFITGEVLINSIVKPQQPVREWRTNFTGLSPAAMAMATARGETLSGSSGARRELWKHIDENTVLVGQSLNFDLNVLGVSHATVVDSMILTHEAVFGGKKGFKRWGLQELCRDILGLKIRQSQNRFGHDSLEDCFAARELVLHCIRSPRLLTSWAGKARRSRFQRSKKNRSKGKPSQSSSRLPPSQISEDDWYDQDSDDEVLHWSDVVDYDVWPKSPPDWSD